MEEKVKFKMKCPIEVGFLFPLETIKNKIKSFCYMHNLNVEFLQSGFFIKNVEILISGECTLQEAYDYKIAFENYLLKLEGIC